MARVISQATTEINESCGRFTRTDDFTVNTPHIKLLTSRNRERKKKIIFLLISLFRVKSIETRKKKIFFFLSIAVYSKFLDESRFCSNENFNLDACHI